MITDILEQIFLTRTEVLRIGEIPYMETRPTCIVFASLSRVLTEYFSSREYGLTNLASSESECLLYEFPSRLISLKGPRRQRRKEKQQPVPAWFVRSVLKILSSDFYKTELLTRPMIATRGCVRSGRTRVRTNDV
jgi:hypothetical protein